MLTTSVARRKSSNDDNDGDYLFCLWNKKAQYLLQYITLHLIQTSFCRSGKLQNFSLKIFGVSF